MKIGTREVGPGHPCFVVAEGGSNHGGSLDAALALTDAAADAGADAMKWQLWDADKMYDPAQFPAEYESAKRWQMPREWLPRLRDRAHERGMAFGCSAFDFESLHIVDEFVDFQKVASIEATWWEFVYKASLTGKPLFVSVGATEAAELGPIIGAVDIYNTVLMGCVVAYPAALEDAHLRHIKELWQLRFGYSDHTTHPTIASCAAVALGACVIEKHIRLSDEGNPDHYWRSAHGRLVGQPTPDFDHSLDPDAFAEMVEAIRLTESALGSSEKRIRESEKPYLKYRRGPRGLRGA